MPETYEPGRIVLAGVKRVEADGRWVEYEEQGSGEPLLLIHGTLFGDALALLMNQTHLSEYRVIRYRRRGYLGNPIPKGAGWLAIADHASDAAMLLEHLEIDQVHLAGHDLGGNIALQLALDAPRIVHSLALIEPILMGVPSWDTSMSELAPAIDLYLAGDHAGAVETFLSIGSGAEGAEILERQMPGALDRAAVDASSFFEGEMFAISEWRLSDEVGFDISQPVLSALSEHPIGFFAEGRTYLHERLPQVEDVDIFNTTHLLPVENPETLAGGLAWFLKRHPMGRPAGI